MPNNCLPRPAEPGLPRLGSCNNHTSGVPQTDVKTTVQALELGDFSETLSPDENAARVVFPPYDEGAAMALFVPLGQSPCMSPTRPLATIPRKGGMPRTGSFDDLALGERQHDLKSVHLGGVKGSQDSFSSTDSSCFKHRRSRAAEVFPRPRLGSCNNLTSGVPSLRPSLRRVKSESSLSPDENAARVVFRPYDEGAAIALFVPLGQSPCMSPTRPLATIPRKGGMPRTGSFDDLALGERQHDLKSVHLGGVKGSFSSTDSSCSSFWLLDSKPDASDASAGDAKLQRRVLVFAESGRGEGDCDMAAQGRPQPDGPCHSWGQAGQR